MGKSSSGVLTDTQAAVLKCFLLDQNKPLHVYGIQKILSKRTGIKLSERGISNIIHKFVQDGIIAKSPTLESNPLGPARINFYLIAPAHAEILLKEKQLHTLALMLFLSG